MVSNSLLNHFDELGLWAVDEHYDIIHRWLDSRSAKLPEGSTWQSYHWHCIVIDVEQALRDGNDEVDGTGKYKGNFSYAQAAENSYQHAMRAPGQSIADAQQKMYDFVQGNIALGQQSAELARSAMRSGNSGDNSFAGFVQQAMTQAVHDIGRAQHPIADSTSPLHAGFQEWKGLLTIDALIHHELESASLYSSMKEVPAMVVEMEMDGALDQVLKE